MATVSSIEAALELVMKQSRAGLSTDVDRKMKNVAKTHIMALDVYEQGITFNSVQSEVGYSRLTIFIPNNLPHESVLADMGYVANDVPYWVNAGLRPILMGGIPRKDIGYYAPKPFWTNFESDFIGKELPKIELVKYLRAKGYEAR